MKAHIYQGIDQVPQDVWDEVARRGSMTQSYTFWKLVENAALNDFVYRYLIFYSDNHMPQALAGFYTVTTDIAIFAPPPLRMMLGWARKVYPNFLKIRMLECGTPVTLTSPPFVLAEGVSLPGAAEALHRALSDIMKREKPFMLVVRDFEANAASLRQTYQRLGYHWVDLLPNTYLNISWPTYDAYLSSMRSYYRSKIVKHMRRNAQLGIRHEVVDDFAGLSEKLCAQWKVVHENAGEFQREVLTPEFYRRFSDDCGKNSKVILFYSGDDLVGHALLLADRETLRWLYFGREARDNDSLYLYVGQAVIRTAIELGFKKLEMGLTTYDVKLDMGARMEPIKMALRARSPLIQPFVGFFYRLLNDTPKAQERDVFKDVLNIRGPPRRGDDE